jgi:hypothetical protein
VQLEHMLSKPEHFIEEPSLNLLLLAALKSGYTFQVVRHSRQSTDSVFAFWLPCKRDFFASIFVSTFRRIYIHM